MNSRPLRYERSELPDCSIPRTKLKNVPERFACYSRLSLPFGYSVSWLPSEPKQRRYGILALLQRTSTVGRPIHSFTLPTPATFVSNVILHHAITLLLTVAVTQSRNINFQKSLCQGRVFDSIRNVRHYSLGSLPFPLTRPTLSELDLLSSPFRKLLALLPLGKTPSIMLTYTTIP